MGWFERELTEERVKKLVARARDRGDEGDFEGAWDIVEPLVAAQAGNAEIALALGLLLERGSFDRDRGLELAGELARSHPENPHVLGSLGAASEALSERRYLNDEPPASPVFADILERLLAIEPRYANTDEELDVIRGLSTVALILGRPHDDVAERAHVRRIALDSERWQNHYDLGLFYKVRGRFAEGLAANRRARDLGGADDEGVIWNLGICATAAADGAAALEAWRQIGLDLELDEHGLPRGDFAGVKVRLAQHPLAERDAAHDAEGPGAEETVWIERLSPCHGIVRVALHYDEIGVDYGDMVLFDGAPITHHRWGEIDVPVFPHLATLARRGYQIYRFTGTQREKGELQALSAELPDDAVVYVHSEQLRHYCQACWEGQGAGHRDHGDDEQRIVTGKLCAPSSISPAELLSALDAAVALREHARVLAPDLSRAAGDDERAEVESRRIAMVSEP